MKKFNSSKNIIITIIIVIVVIFVVTYSSQQRDKSKEPGVTQSLTSDIVAAIDKVVSFPLHTVEGGIRSIGNLFSTYDENEQLKKRIDEFEALDSENQNLKKENEALKEQADLNSTVSNYDKVTASVISRSPDTWQDILIIDRGKNDGVEVNMPVLGNKGLIGRVIVSNAASAKVELLTSTNQNSNHFPVMIIPQTGEIGYGLMEEYAEDEEAFIVTRISTLSGIKKGDKVITSGLGGGSPKGLLVGEVKSIRETGFGLDKEVYVTPVSTMYDIPFVTVVKRLAGSDD